ncbi:MAG TPA: imidazole glycerol phosphate synthase cyclase subunit [Polyangia bacterium]|nr:imidazole glycerol phosphate synthase cyclase subunit [Polyangia bacterium]
MAKTRIIARLDIKGPNLIKGIHLEGLRVLGDPNEHARRYYDEGIDELLYLDVVASLYNRNGLIEHVRSAAERVFIPITVGGGVRSVEDAKILLRAGADKVALNTAATKQPELISELASRFGSQCVVVSIEAKSVAPGRWEAYTDNGREKTGRDVVEWAARAVELGAGELLLTSVDREGTRRGFDVELVRAVATTVTVPVIASGGYGAPAHLVEVTRDGHADAVAIADGLHYKRVGVRDVKRAARDAGLEVRVDA